MNFLTDIAGFHYTDTNYTFDDLTTPILKRLNFDVVIEINVGTQYKYEVDKSTGSFLRLDRVVNYQYPASYGFIPNTLAADGDPLDVFVLGLHHDMPPLTVVRCLPIGIIHMLDSGEVDNKVLAVPICLSNLLRSKMHKNNIHQIVWFLQNYKEKDVITDVKVETCYDAVTHESRAEALRKIINAITTP